MARVKCQEPLCILKIKSLLEMAMLGGMRRKYRRHGTYLKLGIILLCDHSSCCHGQQLGSSYMVHAYLISCFNSNILAVVDMRPSSINGSNLIPTGRTSSTKIYNSPILGCTTACVTPPRPSSCQLAMSRSRHRSIIWRHQTPNNPPKANPENPGSKYRNHDNGGI